MTAGLLATFLPFVAPVLPIEAIKNSAAEVAELDRIVSAAGFRTDGPSLISFFQQRTLPPDGREKLAAAILQLGDDSYEVRESAAAELIAVGMPATPQLQAALAAPDLEIARRAERCLQAIQRGPGPHVPTAAARLLAIRNPPQAATTLIQYAPYADDEYVEEAVFVALAELGGRGAKVDQLFEIAADSNEPSQRAAAGRLLGRSDDVGQRRLAHKLLGDSAVAVRLHSARTLLAKGDKSAVPALFSLLTDAPPHVAWEAEELLCRLAGPTGPDLHLDLTGEIARAVCRSAWETWWRANEHLLDLSRFTLDTRLLGLTIVADLDKGRIMEIGRDHKERWHIEGFKGPVDVQCLPNGRILVAENHGRRVTERDRTGKIHWERATSAFPASCQRTANGNTFIATYNEILEVTPDGREILKLAWPDGIYSARKLRSGRMIVVNSKGRVATLDPSGKEISSFESGGVASWSSIEVLNNAHCLLCGNSNKVVEFDPSGRRVWECSIPYAVSATRLPNGHTLVCSSEGRRVVEIDRTGKEVWEHKTPGRPWHVVRR